MYKQTNFIIHFLFIILLIIPTQFIFSSECMTSFETKTSFRFLRSHSKAGHIKEQYKKLSRIPLTDIKPNIENTHLKLMKENGETIQWRDFILAEINKEKVYLKKIDSEEEVKELANFLILEEIGVKTLFEGVVKTEDGILYLVQKFASNQLISAFFIEGLADFIDTNPIQKQLLFLINIFNLYGIDPKGIQFILSTDSTVYITNPRFSFLGKRLTQSVVQEIQIEFSQIVKNVQRNYAPLQSITSMSKITDEPLHSQIDVDNQNTQLNDLKDSEDSSEEYDVWNRVFAGQKAEDFLPSQSDFEPNHVIPEPNKPDIHTTSKNETQQVTHSADTLENEYQNIPTLTERIPSEDTLLMSESDTSFDWGEPDVALPELDLLLSNEESSKINSNKETQPLSSNVIHIDRFKKSPSNKSDTSHNHSDPAIAL